jgi:hypothetical protein
MHQKSRPVDENQATEHGIEVFLGLWLATSHLISSGTPVRHCRTHPASRQANKKQSTGSSLLPFRSFYPDLQIPAQSTDLQTLCNRDEAVPTFERGLPKHSRFTHLNAPQKTSRALALIADGFLASASVCELRSRPASTLRMPFCFNHFFPNTRDQPLVAHSSDRVRYFPATCRSADVGFLHTPLH